MSSVAARLNRLEPTAVHRHATVIAGIGGDCFHITPTSQSLANVVGDLTLISVSGFDVRDANGVPQPSTQVGVRDGLMSIGIARSFWYEKLFLGSSLRVVHEDIAGSVKDTVVGDVGAILKPNPTLSLGLIVVPSMK